MCSGAPLRLMYERMNGAKAATRTEARAAAAPERELRVALRLLLERDGHHALVHSCLHVVRSNDAGGAAHAAGGVDAEHRLAGGAERVRHVQLGLHHALEQVGRLAEDDRVDVGPCHLRVVERSDGGFPDQAGERHVAPTRLVVRLPDADDGGWLPAHESPSRMQTRFCCRHGPDVECARVRCLPPSTMARAASEMRTRPVAMIGICCERAARLVHRDRLVEPEHLPQEELLVRERSLQLGDIDGTVGETRGLGGDPRRRGVGEVAQGRVVALGSMLEAGDPRGTLAELLRAARGREHHRARTVADGRQVVAAEWGAHVVLCEQVVDVEVAGDLSVRVRLRVTATACRDLRHVALGDLARVDQRARLERGEAQRVDAEWCEVVGVHLHRVDQRGVRSRRAARTGDHRDLDVTVVQAEPRLVERPRSVHLHVRVAFGRPRADGVEVADERERRARDVVAAPRGT